MLAGGGRVRERERERQKEREGERRESKLTSHRRYRKEKID